MRCRCRRKGKAVTPVCTAPQVGSFTPAPRTTRPPAEATPDRHRGDPQDSHERSPVRPAVVAAWVRPGNAAARRSHADQGELLRHPGWVKTDMGGPSAPMEVSEGGKTSVQLATLPDDGPSGGYFHLGEPLPW